MNEKIKRVVIETCCWIIFLVIVFFFITYLSLRAMHDNDFFKDAWSDSISFFSALSTLGAAIVAAYLVNNWKQQTRYNEQLKCLAQVIDNRDKLLTAIRKILNEEKTFSYLNQFFSEKSSEKIQFIAPSFEEVDEIINKIRSKVFECEMYGNYGENKIFPQTSTGFDNLYHVILKIDDIKKYTLAIPRIFPINGEFILNNNHIFIASTCSMWFLKFYGLKYQDNEKFNIRNIDELNSIFEKMLDDCKKYREFLEENN